MDLKGLAASRHSISLRTIKLQVWAIHGELQPKIVAGRGSCRLPGDTITFLLIMLWLGHAYFFFFGLPDLAFLSLERNACPRHAAWMRVAAAACLACFACNQKSVESRPLVQSETEPNVTLRQNREPSFVKKAGLWEPQVQNLLISFIVRKVDSVLGDLLGTLTLAFMVGFAPMLCLHDLHCL